MQTRKRQDRSKVNSQKSSQDAPLEAIVPNNNHKNNNSNDDSDAIIGSEQDTEMPVVETQESMDLEHRPQVFTAVLIPAKRKKSMDSPVPAKKIEIPHSAKLPRIVWVFDDKYQWWPGKITKYPPVNNKATVSRFGNVKPKTITVECLESNILPFGDKPQEHLLSKHNTSHSEAFENALKQASEAQIEDDDDLPGWDDVMNGLSTAPVHSVSTPAPSAIKESQRKLVKTESIYLPDMNLSIPGELVLAWSERFYYPGRISSFNNKTNKYKIDYATGHSQSIERKKFYTRYEKGFQTCPLGALAIPTITENYRDKELEAQIHELYPALYDIVAGKHDEAGRLKAFMEGGKAKRALAQRVGPGRFGRGEYGLISTLLQIEFLPDLATTKQSHPGLAALTEAETMAGSPMKCEGDVTQDFSDQMRLHFVTDVLLPEMITLLTMRRRNISYAEADREILECKRDEITDTWWVDDILAARESFLEGNSR